MRVSVVLCEHTLDRYADLREAAESVFAQSYDDVELVLVSDGNEAVYRKMVDDWGDRDDTVIHCNDENVGLLRSRNTGAELASGELVAFLDDDAVADPEWLERLVDAYERHDVPAVGGPMTPAWVAGKPEFLPAEFYWLVGVTHKGFAEGEGEVRNTFGSNIAFERAVFLDLGGFQENIGGRQGDKNLQGGETELCARMKTRYGHGVYFVPDAEVAHKVFDYRTDPRWLCNRAFWQGYSKRGMEKFVPGSGGEEGDFLGKLLFSFVPERLAGLVRSPSLARAEQLVFLLLLTGLVGLGYLYGVVKWR
ncbi:glucosyl-dolichyl phosphate glucuronosyltransferase [Natronomonas sp. EA1]|uniref:glucosyl-dolichyl phosphate glucuronosyltransferase n=1 Tax=Natronomonas sp. EA1 TaxID=3421655 RepID=UPI003EBFAD9E